MLRIIIIPQENNHYTKHQGHTKYTRNGRDLGNENKTGIREVLRFGEMVLVVRVATLGLAEGRPAKVMCQHGPIGDPTC